MTGSEQETARKVTPHAGVRIEILITDPSAQTVVSPPTRGCELKYISSGKIPRSEVTPHAGVRIEIDVLALNKMAAPSPPTRGCELKFFEPFRQAET